MLELMKDVPDHVVGIRATEKVTEDDYKQVFIPAVERAAREYGEINLIMVFDTDLSNITYAAWMQDAKTSIKNYGKWNKMAIVIDSKFLEKLSYLFTYVSPADSKGFPPAELEAAKAWVAAPREKGALQNEQH